MPSRRTYVLVTLAVVVVSCLLSVAGCKSSKVSFGKDVLAMVDGEPITVEEFRTACGGEIPEDLPKRKEALGRMINDRLAAKAAINEGMLGDESAMGEMEGFYTERLPAFLYEKIYQETKVTDEDIQAVKKKQDLKPVVGVSVLIAPTMEEAEAAKAELGKGADFKQTAAKHQVMKGETDQEISLGEGLYPVGVRAVLNRMKPGELSPIMKMEVGYAIFRVNYKNDPEQVWKGMVEQVKKDIRKAKAEAERTRLLDRLRSSADLKLKTRKLPNGEVQYLGAVVNGIDITMDPRLFNPGSDPHFAHQGLNPKTLRDALNKRINNVLFSQEARRIGLDEDPEFKRIMAQKRVEILSNAMLRRVQGTYSPTSQEIREYYEKNKSRFTRNTKVRVSRILLPTRAEAEAVLRELKSGQDFAALAKARSTDSTTKEKGGDVGFVSSDMLKEPLKGTIERLKTGETSGVVESEYGFEILRATDRIEGGPQPMSNITTTLRKRVVLNKISERVEEYYSKLAAKADIQVNDGLLAKLAK